MTNVTPPVHIPPLHPQLSLLRAYALGQLVGPPHTQVETHALACAECSAQIRQWRAELVAALETLPQPEHLPPLRLPAGVPARPPRPLVSYWAWAAAVAGVLAVGSVGRDTLQIRQTQAQAQAEQTQITRWLAQPDVQVVVLRGAGRRLYSRALTLPDRRVLFVLPQAPAGQEYHAWVAHHWQRGDLMQRALVSQSGVFEIGLGANDYLCVSLEARDSRPKGPTKVMGWALL
ncbi:hypothetical protein E7T06_02780 [Deinococcus sp. Arct2-2]|uniref:hypothetical protein n=1 Tax=Deinococcus sp. Arct2-2 TaxID=2568653 RepID=UPI0010A3B439|nr:hypothetical protein [Deinococcus sp. Arct2-2]THF71552.1 hypothetical protein E7T06_02780 [Deinococcus sp. Arct2-2]